MQTREHPKILLVDVLETVLTALQDQGHCVSSGSFGAVYDVERAGRLLPVELNGQLSRYTEQDIIVVDLNGRKQATETYEPKVTKGAEQLWASCESGEIDPRPFAMSLVRKDFDRILNNGGIFVVFARARQDVAYISARVRGYALDESGSFSLNDWGFLSALEAVRTDLDHGTDIRITDGKGAAQFRGHLLGGEFFCTLGVGRNNAIPYWIDESEWVPIATNRYGACVAAILGPSEKRARNGWIFIFPQVAEQAAVLGDLLSNLFPQIAPRLFPGLAESRWVHRPEYEVSSILEVQAQIEAVKAAAEKEVARLNDELTRLRADHADWYTLLSGTGDDLVQAVIRTLRRFGFTHVIDVDAEAKASATQGSQLREDIRIHDDSPVLVVDVKGINGHPEDAEAQQAEKHTLMRSRDLNRTDVRALSIINAQRHLPPHERDIVAYRQALIDNAVQVGSGLMTTWDLCLIRRNMDAHGWTSEEVKPIFYQHGRIRVLPAHYQPLGSIVKVWRKAVGVIPTRVVSVGATVAVTSGNGEFRELPVRSINVDGKAMSRAEPGSNCGIEVEDSAGIKEGHRVYHVVRVAQHVAGV